jgi:hypothetical protein
MIISLLLLPSGVMQEFSARLSELSLDEFCIMSARNILDDQTTDYCITRSLLARHDIGQVDVLLDCEKLFFFSVYKTKRFLMNFNHRSVL